MHFDLLYQTSDAGVDAISEHSTLLAEALDALAGHSAQAVDHGEEAATDLLGGLRPATADVLAVLVLQYNPFSFSRFGTPMWLSRALHRVRAARPDIRIVLLAHELFLPWRRNRTLPVAAAQRALLAELGRQVDVQLASCERFAHLLQRWTRQPSAVLPVSSNLPCRTDARVTERARLGLGDDDFVVASFGRNHPTRLVGHVEAAVAAIAAVHPNVVFMNLGASSPPMATSILDPRRILRPGQLPGERTAALLSAADLFLLPLEDGLSLRRGTFMAAMQHGVPILSTAAHNTDSVLWTAPGVLLVSTSAGTAGYANAAGALTRDAAIRKRMRAANLSAFAFEYAWPRIAADLVRMTAAAGARTKRD